jgi:uncharacterized RDD family membrane protein YckC
MKCPKCDYLGFETGDKCRNCGYDFSLIATPAEAPTPDLVLNEPPVQAAEPPPLPLFLPGGRSDRSDEPLITRAGPPRPPLAVRRTPEIPRLRSTSRPLRRPDPEPVLDFIDDGGDLADAPELEAPPPALPSSGTRAEAPEDSPLSRRVIAAFIDVAIMLAIDLGVVYFTLRMAALTMADWRALPPVPMLAFLAILKVGYFSAFTSVGGQTIGKMAAGIQVIGEDRAPVDPVRALQRVLTGVLSTLTFGLAFIPALIGPDRRPLHDRVARTRVVTRVS